MSDNRPRNLDPSELGTKEYWDDYYQNDLDTSKTSNEPTDLSQLESWFEEVGAPEKVLEYLTSETFPLSPNNSLRATDSPSILDLGTGNGSALFQLLLDGGYRGKMVGVDYSQQSVDLAGKLWQDHVDNLEVTEDEEPIRKEDITFEKADLIQADLSQESWWPKGGFDLVHDKGTFDAVSLSSETITDSHGTERRIFEYYPANVIPLVKPGGYLIITSCNWTENELRRWFLERDEVRGKLQEYGSVKYPVYEFGGRKGQSVASLCFKRVEG